MAIMTMTNVPGGAPDAGQSPRPNIDPHSQVRGNAPNLDKLKTMEAEVVDPANKIPQLARGMTPPDPDNFQSEQTQDVLDQIQDEWNKFLDKTGRNADDIRNRVRQFLNEIAPDVDVALAEKSERALSYLDDRIRGMTGRVSLGFIYRQRDAFISIAMSVIRTAIKFIT
jgi:hypothetical protein